MTKLTRQDDESAELPAEYDDDEIEILEVVGLDDDSPAALPIVDDEPEESDEIVVDFDEESRAGGGVHAPTAAPEEEDGADRERLLRLHADFENFRRRVDREREAMERHSTAALVTRLLPVLDNFERAVAAGGTAEDPEGIRNGVALIFRQLLDELRREGLTAIDSLGQPFDPSLHDAVATEHTADLPHHTVVEEMQRGYLLHDRLLRPALVTVSVNPDAPEHDDEDR